MHATHGERDTQRLFKGFGCTLPVPVSRLEFTGTTGSCKLPFLKVSDYLSYLLRRYPELLLGGYKRGVEARELLKNFWQGYRDFHPEHLAFTKFTPEELCRVIPVAIHGDKGRGYLKLPIFCFSFEGIFGLPKDIRDRSCRPGDSARREHGGKLQWSCGERSLDQIRPEVIPDGSCPKRRRLNSGEVMSHNGRGHVFMSRFLGAAIPSKMFKQHPGLVPAYLEELQHDLTGLFDSGIMCEGELYHAALIGVKGDFEFQLEVAGYSRSYANVGSVRDRAFCP